VLEVLFSCFQDNTIESGSMTVQTDFQDLVSHFNCAGVFLRAERYGSGHINDTYLLLFELAGGSIKRYILQRINNFVFQNPAGLMKNIAAVTGHLRRKVIAAGGDPDRETLSLVPTSTSQSFHLTEEGQYWRCYHFIENTIACQTPPSLQHVVHAARAFGNFQGMLHDFPAADLVETIPDFHNTPKRFEDLFRAVELDLHHRARDVADELDFILQRKDELAVVVDRIEQGSLPIRVTHNDTKFNNVLLDEVTGEGVCIIDLDTVMPGSVLYDFGDAIRSIANTAEEDQRDLSKVHFDLEVIDAFARGYLDATRHALTPHELDLLAFSARLMTLECGIRFLTDHLNGDVYFRIQRENHNLDRCRTQFKLVQEMELHDDEMQQIVRRHAAGL